MDERSYRGGHPPYCTCVNCTVKRKSPKKGCKIFNGCLEIFLLLLILSFTLIFLII